MFTFWMQQRASQSFALAAMSLLSLASFAAPAQAQDVTSGAIGVLPLTAAANTARRITLFGVWPNGCPPNSAIIVSETPTAPRTLTLRLNELMTLVACTQVLTPFRIELDYTPQTPGVLHINLLQASGRYTARPLPGSKARRTGQLDADALQRLLAEVLVQQRFATISGPAIVAEIEAISQRTGRLFNVMDGGETTIEVTLPDVRHQVVLAAMQAAYRRFPEVEPLQRLHAVQQRLLALADTAQPPR